MELDDEQRVEILAEILRERLPTVRHVVDEWSVAGSDPVSYAQTKDLIWQIAGALGLAMVGYSAAERARHEDPGDLELLEAQRLFARSGEDVGRVLERFLAAAARVRD
jgi:hypothetical protein